MYKVITVSYLNTKPFINGIKRYFDPSELILTLENPARCAEELMKGQADVGLIPVAVYPDLTDYLVFSDYCIGCDGAVGTVKIFSESPLETCHSVYLDYQSRTSVILSKIILQEYLDLNPTLLESASGYESLIQGRTAGLIIGDRCFYYNNVFPFQLDLGMTWKQWTGLPFVFAVWVYKKGTDPTFLKKMNQALATGVGSIPSDFNSPEEVFYLSNNISFDFDLNKRLAMTRFLNSCKSYEPKLHTDFTR